MIHPTIVCRSGRNDRSDSKFRPGNPGVEDVDTAPREVVGVSGGHGSSMSTGDRGYLAVELADRTPSCPAPSCDNCVSAGGLPIKWQDPISQVLIQN